jgi:hypothetical protein
MGLLSAGTNRRRTPSHPGRRRRINGLTLLVAASLVAGLWCFSGWWMTRFISGPLYLHCAKGQLAIVYAADRAVLPTSTGWDCGRMDAFVVKGQSLPLFEYGGFQARTNPATPVNIRFPLWPLPIVLTALGLPLLLSGISARRKVLQGFCAVCGYDCRTLGPIVPCPECGSL